MLASAHCWRFSLVYSQDLCPSRSHIRNTPLSPAGIVLHWLPSDCPKLPPRSPPLKRARLDGQAPECAFQEDVRCNENNQMPSQNGQQGSARYQKFSSLANLFGLIVFSFPSCERFVGTELNMAVSFCFPIRWSTNRPS